MVKISQKQVFREREAVSDTGAEGKVIGEKVAEKGEEKQHEFCHQRGNSFQQVASYSRRIDLQSRELMYIHAITWSSTLWKLLFFLYNYYNTFSYIYMYTSHKSLY